MTLFECLLNLSYDLENGDKLVIQKRIDVLCDALLAIDFYACKVFIIYLKNYITGQEELKMQGLPVTVNQFWDIFEEELLVSIKKNPADYAYSLDKDANIEVFASNIRKKMQATAECYSISRINLDSATFRRVAKRCAVEKFSQSRLKLAYACYGGK